MDFRPRQCGKSSDQKEWIKIQLEQGNKILYVRPGYANIILLRQKKHLVLLKSSNAKVIPY